MPNDTLATGGHHDACGLGFVARADGRSSRELVEHALEILDNLAHRGATGADDASGDGAGVLLQIPDALLRRECAHARIELPPPGDFAVGMLFMSQDPERRLAGGRLLERIAAEERAPVIGWREVPVAASAIGPAAAATAPLIRQAFLRRPPAADDDAFDRRLYVIRRRLHHLAHARGLADDCYVASLSSRTVVYKGLLRGPQVARFYLDLADPATTSALAIVHSRFSTNTLGSWPLAHPYRLLAHNGEINTLRGNYNWMRAREAGFAPSSFGGDMAKLRPILEPGVSDSAALDNVLEFLVLTGRSLPHAVMLTIPEAWEHDHEMDRDRRAFYEYASALAEPWDGPAAVAFTDGRLVGATLDRNGLRPARLVATRDGLVVVASEDGVLGVDPSDIVLRSRLGPGQMVLVDPAHGGLLRDDEAKRPVVEARRWREWLDAGSVDLVAGPPAPTMPRRSGRAGETWLESRQRAFGYTLEDVRLLLRPMATTGKEPDGSMGTDTPLAVLSSRPQRLSAYFKQLFAQVTNPPIDPLREAAVMSLRTVLGAEGDVLSDGPAHCRRVVLPHPVLDEDAFARVCALDEGPFRARVLDAGWPLPDAPGGLAAAVERLCDDAATAVRDGATLLVLSDRAVDACRAPIPSLLATAAVHHRLVGQGLRMRTSLIVESGDVREVHDLALHIGYGAMAVHPWLALATVAHEAEAGELGDRSATTAVAAYLEALSAGLRKVLSKLGISTVSSYCGAQLFEAVGLGDDLVARHFTGTASRLGGIGLAELATDTLALHQQGFGADADGQLDAGGIYQLRADGERHQWDGPAIVGLQRAARIRDQAGFRAYARHIDEGPASTLRSLLELAPGAPPVPLDAVEPATGIVRRFATGAMSLGSISREAHETLAIAMNRLGGRSNTGEGGEDPRRSLPRPGGDSVRSAIKQVASARFGVTATYLADADVLQIKIAQGAKPGEGGQLPGHKVSPEIAALRYATPGVGLISPPPHHDIYSIEDLAQLIYDLRCVSPDAQISVKLVAAVGVGTIAAGVAKADADHIVIAGHDGGTGASPLSAIKHAGLPWELGLAETQQVLVETGLRGRVRLQVDGQLRTGRDVVVAGLLGADEFAFSTAPLVAAGCVMMRVCHLNTCPVGIATQDPELRRRFAGQPEHVVNFFLLLAEDVRRHLASLGVARFDELVGRADLLVRRRLPAGSRAASLDLSGLLGTRPAPAAPQRSAGRTRPGPGDLLDHELVRQARRALEDGEPVRLRARVRNTDRSVGAFLSGEIARRHGTAGLAPATIRVDVRGTAGQSFGAWGAAGLELVLTGATNDYAGKGLCGATLVVAPPPGAGYVPEDSAIVGNVALYGATAGEAYFRGLAGERFAVRNSGAHAVVEGVGDHGCEYMTGGTVVVLGPTGRNFAAGMTGGLAFVHDPWERMEGRCNTATVTLTTMDPTDDAVLQGLLRAHAERTGSPVARHLLTDWTRERERFVKVYPDDLRRLAQAQSAGRLLEQVR